MVAAGVGLGAGLVGAGGAFLLVPLLLYVVRVPLRVTIGSSLAITAFASISGVAGKLATGQVALVPALAVVAGALPGAQIGSHFSARLLGRWLKIGLAAIVVLFVWGGIWTERTDLGPEQQVPVDSGLLLELL